MNHVSLIGNLTRDIELRKTQTGLSTCTFTLAVNGPKQSDGTRRTDYPQITAWRQTAELCAKYLHKGSKAGIEGRIQTRSYEKDGRKVYVTEIAADRVEFLTPKGSAPAQNAGEANDDGYVEVDTDDDLPF